MKTTINTLFDETTGKVLWEVYGPKAYVKKADLSEALFESGLSSEIAAKIFTDIRRYFIGFEGIYKDFTTKPQEVPS